MNPIPIPDSFQLFGKTITVAYDPRLMVRDDALGSASYNLNCILLQNNSASTPRTPEDIEHTFLHELTHMILNALHRDDLNDDESFIDLFSALLHQALATAQFKETDNG